VVPIVLYTGTRTWNRLLKLSELIEQDEDLSGLAPEFAPLFLNVGQIAGAELEARGGAFGLLLRLVQQRRVRRSVFEATLRRVVRALEDQLAEADRDRIVLVVLRGAPFIEQKPDATRCGSGGLGTERRPQGEAAMGQTIAEALKEEGRAEEAVRSRQETLLELIQTKFGEVPAGVRRRVENTESVDQLKTWIKTLIKARRLSGVGIPPLE
jgi:hypothetical protein